ncbi:hypothetical protein [Geobacter sp.]|uniref:hypothetical protein n=1 Tax=Geobacter sp. TaxID=46610 RepID=UPI00262C2489|nr:hypothetical protein [Geobacter sp.]
MSSQKEIMILHCPLCHGQFSIEALIQDQAGRDLLVLMAQHGQLGPQLLQYLTLFRSEKRALAFDRALRLAKEALEIPASPEQLAAAMAETVEALRGRGGKPLKNHNYLRRVLESQAATPPSPPYGIGGVPEGRGGVSRRKAAIAALVEWAGLDWKRTAIAGGLAALVAANLKNAPAVDTIGYTADIWLRMAATCTIPEIDAPRIEAAFAAILDQATEWPEPRALKEHLPRRPERAKVGHEISDEQRQQGRDAARAIHALLEGATP